ncbi:MAG TPA: galactokinase [Candidatus Massiliomicrobiota merdigallinarum]|jgi:galactokinase|uniref:galactokinase n=1 Tax=Massilimicrobiota sp. An134 TaxID=1965557 RepID=UPI000B3A7105|nr:galactokinase family protein [Massilimicrobiota sp. An134]OUQ29955.1 galactokinase [Massilimicrobiota sp. An134]HJA52875.1 galactokinase [Candidatus Massilimicrobiota merdigallinarum]
MKKASLIIQDIQNNVYNDTFLDIYVDQEQLEHQKLRYVQAIEKFIDLYGDQEVSIYSTPGRSEVCGNHTDHQHGEVLAAAINLDIIAVVAKDDTKIKILSDDYDIEAIHIDDLTLRENEKESSEGLIRGILARFQQLQHKIGGFVGYMTSDVLQGSGLSSSAAFEVMIGTILSGMYNDMKVDPVTIAKIGQYSENVYFGKPCGLMDQCACSVGSLIHIDFKDNENPIVEKINVDFPRFHHSLCIVDVHASHADLTEDYASIPEELKEVDHFFHQEYLRDVDEKEFYEHLTEVREAVNDRAVLRAIHVFKENKRVQQAVQSLKQEDFDTFKTIVKASGESSFKYLQNIYSNHYVGQQAVSLALALSENLLGAHGVCRVHGGGFAGTIQAFVEDDYVEAYKQGIEKYFGEGSCHILKIRKYGGMKVID